MLAWYHTVLMQDEQTCNNSGNKYVNMSDPLLANVDCYVALELNSEDFFYLDTM